MTTAYWLRCRECGKTYGHQPLSICDECFSPLEVAYDLEYARTRFTRETISQGPQFIILNLAIGGDWPGSPDSSTVFPGDMQVDYVRIYTN